MSLSVTLNLMIPSFSHTKALLNHINMRI
jgi:hypothetical protein